MSPCAHVAMTAAPMQALNAIIDFSVDDQCVWLSTATRRGRSAPTIALIVRSDCVMPLYPPVLSPSGNLAFFEGIAFGFPPPVRGDSNPSFGSFSFRTAGPVLL